MKEPSPLVPQGSFEAMARGKSHVRIAFYTIVAVHLLVIGGLLILGCKREDKEKDIAASDVLAPTNDLSTPPPFGSDPAIVSPGTATTSSPAVNVATSSPAAGSTGLAPIPPLPLPTNPPPTVPPPFEAADTVLREHTIVARDTFGSLATKYGVSVRAIQAANQGVDPTKLKIGQKVKIPPKSLAAGRNGTGAGTVSSDAGDTYVVRSGDNLSKIATSHGTTVKDLQRLNNLSTTQIRVGQKLKVPPRPTHGTPSPGAVPAPAPAQ